MNGRTTRVKVCGIKNIEDARAIFEAGADELGFHVQLERARSPLSAEEAHRLIAQLPPTASTVLVTSVVSPEELASLARKTAAGTIQLYGEATPEALREVKHQMPALKLWKVIGVVDESAIEEAKKYGGVVDAVVLDSTNARTAETGGTGKPHDWDLSRRIREATSLPVVLAGGLTPDNVKAAIEIVQPYAVDVNSGVSNEDGTKDIEKVKAFIAAAKKV